MTDDPSSEDLYDLAKVVDDAYLRESNASSLYERSCSSRTLSVRELNLEKNGISTTRSQTPKLEVLGEWKKLVGIIKVERVFVDYDKSLSVAFTELGTADASLYRHLNTLVRLLAHTAENSYCDNSTECRFVTLLEVMRSYGSNWAPSEAVSRFWVRLMQRIPANVPAVNFRRKAYRVLVSLAWVPSSKGLLEACSFEETRQNVDPDMSPAQVRKHLDRIRSRPQPRYDCVNQVLDRLKDETDVCVGITSDKSGMGKTTLAALVASHPSILRVFQVVWLDVKQRDETIMTYQRYIKYLNEMCEQLAIKLVWPECVKRFEEPAIQRLREEAAMKRAKEMMTQALLQRDESMLLVLDDLTSFEHLQWFRFSDRQSIIVTTSNTNLEGVDWTVDLGPMSEEEAVELFLSEANFPITHVLGLTSGVRSIVRHCEFHPLTVRTAGRWFVMKHVTSGIGTGVEELVAELSKLTTPEESARVKTNGGTSTESTPLLFDILSLMLRPSRKGANPTSILFVLCLAAIVSVFPDETPLDSVLLLCEQLLKVERHAVDEISSKQEGDEPSSVEVKKHTWFVVEGLTHMGIISVSVKDESPWVEVHHKLYRDFALQMARTMDLGETYEDAVTEWNKAFVTAYFKERIENTSDIVDDNSWEYSIEKLPSHIFQAKMFPMAETVLSEEHFFKARIEAMGWDRALDVHIADCIQLQNALETNLGVTTATRQQISPVFEKMAAVVKTQAEGTLGTSDDGFVVGVANALFKIGIALAENRYFDEAIAHFDSAQNLLPQSQELRASILYGAAWTLLAVDKSEIALKKIKACKKIMDDHTQDHILFKEARQLLGEALISECEYKEAAEYFEQSVDTLRADSDNSTVELGKALYFKARLHQTMGDLESAKTCLAESLKWKQTAGEVSKNLSSVHSVLADIYTELGNVVEARDHYEHGIQVLDTLNVSSEHVVHRLLTGKLRLLRSEFDSGLHSLDLARTAINAHPRLLMDQSAYDLRCISRSYQTRGDLETAVKVLQESLALTDQRHYSLERSIGLHELANCLLDQNDVREALMCLEQCLEIRILKLGESVQVLDTLNAIGNVHLSLGASEEAYAVFNKVEELVETIAPNDVERVAGVLYSIGDVLDAKKQYEDAIEKFNECMDVLKREKSDDHPHIAKALQRIGDVSTERKDLAEAFKCYKEALRIRKMHFDDRSKAESLHSIGVLFRKRRDYDAAREPLLDALEIRRRLPHERETAATLLEMGNIYRLEGEIDNAVSLYEAGLSLKKLDENDELRGDLFLALGHAKMSLRRDTEALYSYEKAREIRVMNLGRDTLKSANVSNSIGLIKCLMNKSDEALVHFNEFIRVVEMIEDDNDAEDDAEDASYVLAVMLMSDIHKEFGREEQAHDLIEVAREVCEEGDGQVRFLEQEVRLLTAQKETYRLISRVIRSTTERVMASPDDELANAYDTGETLSHLWLPSPPSNGDWPGGWESYQTTDSSKQERRVIQPAIDNDFQPKFPSSSPYVMVNTSPGWQKMTQDATLFLKDRSQVELTAAAIFEWVGQDESPFPSKTHKAKFVRDCMRLYSRCGRDREVHGVITDLSRIVAVKLVALNEDATPSIVKTAIFEGERVRTILTQFAFAQPSDLGIERVADAVWNFDGRKIEGGRALGSGLHGNVFSVAHDNTKFVKSFKSARECEEEKTVLDKLQQAGVPNVPRVEAISTDKCAFMASPVGKQLKELQGQTAAWLLAAKFVDCLEQAHGADVCHRDIRPTNMGFLSTGTLIDDTTQALLFDWASAAATGIVTSFVGTVHYAATEVLENIKNSGDPIPKPEHDLESLVYSFYDITRQPAAPPRALSIDGSLDSDALNYARNVQEAWETESRKNPSLAELLVDARACNYSGLSQKMSWKAS